MCRSKTLLYHWLTRVILLFEVNMESSLVLVLACCVAAMAVTIAILVYHMIIKGQTPDIREDSSVPTQSYDDNQDVQEITHEDPHLPAVRFEESAPLTELEESRLVKVEDHTLLARIDSTIPVLFNGSMGVASIANLNTALQLHNSTVESAGTIYRAIVPHGAQLSQSHSMEGAVRGIYHDVNGIAGHANLVAVDAKVDPAITGTLGTANAVSAAMNVASMVVGQYYMTEINKHLKQVTKRIDVIADFQAAEYRSKVYALVASVQKYSEFQVELLENDELRLRALSSLDNLEHECAQYLGQANLQLRTLSERRGLSFDEYEKAIFEADGWFQCQQVLLKVMEEITRLVHALNRGKVSIGYCLSTYQKYAAQSESALYSLRAWHGDQMSQLEFDCSKSRRRRKGIEGFLMGVPGIFNDDFNYNTIDEGTTSAINKQMSAGRQVDASNEVDLYQEDVDLVVKEGSLYYLLPENS